MLRHAQTFALQSRMPFQVQQMDMCAAPGGAGECMYSGFWCVRCARGAIALQKLAASLALTHSLLLLPLSSLPCSLGGLVTEIVAVDPTATHLQGCCGNACLTFVALGSIPYVGGMVALASMLPPVYAKIAGPNEPPLPCCTAICCGGCVMCQMKNEVALRRSQGQPIVPPPMVMMPMVMPQPVMQK